MLPSAVALSARTVLTVVTGRVLQTRLPTSTTCTSPRLTSTRQAAAFVIAVAPSAADWLVPCFEVFLVGKVLVFLVGWGIMVVTNLGKWAQFGVTV